MPRLEDGVKTEVQGIERLLQIQKICRVGGEILKPSIDVLVVEQM
jgi:hypothetical protein